MRISARYLRWLLPVLVLLILATALVLLPAISSHAAGLNSGGGFLPNAFWSW
ncbi:MAG: hypothetical protein IMW89_11645 [Ktedonobacteraceae bacterium]|nr:hypothetical protein [Ktedonobacteraceae bacterium]